MDLSRRTLLVTASAIPGRFFAAANAAAATGKTEALWFQRMRRCVQHNFNEYDPKVLDIASWVDYWASLKTDCIVLNAGGLMAFYPTELPHHHKSQFLGTETCSAIT